MMCQHPEQCIREAKWLLLDFAGPSVSGVETESEEPKGTVYCGQHKPKLNGLHGTDSMKRLVRLKC